MRTGLRYGLYGLVFLAAAAVSAYLTVFFVVRGQPEVDVPDLVGQDAVTALRAVSETELYVTVRAMDFSDHVPKDHVVSQDPRPGSRLKKHREIRVVLSKGRADVPLPDLVGLSLDQAQAILVQHRLSVDRISYAYGPLGGQGRDQVLAQAPEALTALAPGSKVALLVSLGPRPKYLLMPDLTGQPYSMALLTLERLGLSLGGLEAETYGGWPPDSVVLQEPAPGRRAAVGDMVRLTVNRDEATAETFNYFLLTYDVPYGLFHHHLRFRVALGAQLVDLHDGWHPPGETVMVPAVLPGRPRGRIYDDLEEAARIGGPGQEP